MFEERNRRWALGKDTGGLPPGNYSIKVSCYTSNGMGPVAYTYVIVEVNGTHSTG